MARGSTIKMPIGFKASGSLVHEQEENEPRPEKNKVSSNLVDDETIPRLIEWKEKLGGDELTSTVIDSYIQLFSAGVLDITFDPYTGEPKPDLIKAPLPQFVIKEPSLVKSADPLKELLEPNKDKNYIN